MPAKQVRFMDDNFVYPPSPSTPSSSYSMSPASSAGVLTPPSLHYTSPLPFIAVEINPILGCSPHGYTALPALSYDLTLPPSSATTLSRQALPSHILSESATVPPQPHLTLLCSTHLPWPIVITASHPQVGVTVGDVLHGLHGYLRLAVSEAEYRSLPSPDAQAQVTLSFQARYKRIPDRDGYEWEKSKGVKRIDFLMGRVRWTGLSSSKAGPDVWVLNVA